ncbi:hypothetical protein SARC_09119 [Sphaeroforma arctica JP610]|uniref:Uncharacterized protein n=1 Tax=Sphaeroforma arctica JP610 TaxID=667725 RepID=A0A0L0FNX6_9EUKA|nr:hypothetical protein SARC_09119 [Sphaeroforma arctica JP610]KNC78444.1 hypothetical protein SARC_09119 [Sphaeroforma arctica JP610]|eukprot:XP_014152346.1 hypothetical protein SARC_09119 [Sphaeroforma arctica JP610]
MVSRIIASAALVAHTFASSIVARQTVNATVEVNSTNATVGVNSTMVNIASFCTENTATCDTYDFCQTKVDELTNLPYCDSISTVIEAYNDAICITEPVEITCDADLLCKWSTSKGKCVGDNESITIVYEGENVTISNEGVAPQNGTYEHAPSYCRTFTTEIACDAVVGVCEWELADNVETFADECGTKKKTITNTNQLVCTGLEDAACGADLRCEFGNETEGCLGSEKMFLLPTAI